MSEEVPAPSPEGVLIRRAREAYVPRLSVRAAATRVGLSVEYWGYVERGYQPAGRGNPVKPVVPGAQTLALMAFAVEVRPEELEDVDRADSADILREIVIRQRARETAKGAEYERNAELVKKMAEFFEDESVPAAERKAIAERFFKLLPFYMTGQRPPRELLDDGDNSANGPSKSA